MNAAELAELEIEKSKRDRAKAGGHAKAGTALCSGDTSSPKQERARITAGKLAGVGDRKVRHAQSVMRQSPELAAKVHSGEMPLAAAVREKPAGRFTLGDVPFGAGTHLQAICGP